LRAGYEARPEARPEGKRERAGGQQVGAYVVVHFPTGVGSAEVGEDEQAGELAGTAGATATWGSGADVSARQWSVDPPPIC
jgi:hypothetical protein